MWFSEQFFPSGPIFGLAERKLLGNAQSHLMAQHEISSYYEYNHKSREEK